MSAGGARGGPQSEINVTPLIDVLLVLLIIFLVVMPIMMKKETLEVPPNISDGFTHEAFTVTVKVTGDLVLNDGDKDLPISARDLSRILRPKLDAVHLGTDKVVFVDFEDAVPWNNVIGTMDQIRSLAEDIDHDGIKVALKVKDQVRGEPR